MTILKLHYDGWLALPAALRRKLRLDKGAALKVELVDGTIVLRPSGEGLGSAVGRGRGREATEAPVALASSAPPSPRADTPATREGDRVRKDPDPTPPDQASRPKRPRGRPRKAEVEPGPVAAPLPVPAPLWELRRKADRPAVAAGGDDPAPVPDRRPVRLAREKVHGHEPEERRPFRNVEVRKLGPGRGHDKPCASHSRLQLPGQRTG